MNKYITLFAAFSFLFLFGCSKDVNDLRESIMIYDEEYPGLPIYSEYGYNTFGAYYERGEFIYNSLEVPGKVLVQNGNTSFILTGHLDNQSLFSICFTFLNMEFADHTDLLTLDKKSFNLRDTTSCKVSIENKEGAIPIKKTSGNITFNKVHRLLVDKEVVETILAGEFDLQVIINEQPARFSNGRFDIGVGDYNFFSFD